MMRDQKSWFIAYLNMVLVANFLSESHLAIAP